MGRRKKLVRNLLTSTGAYLSRGLRQTEMQRVRLDILDFDPLGLPALALGEVPWVAYGKHLCGAATDFTLACCVRCHRGSSTADALLAVRLLLAWTCPAGAFVVS
jgi:Methyltransferase TRM13